MYVVLLLNEQEMSRQFSEKRMCLPITGSCK